MDANKSTESRIGRAVGCLIVFMIVAAGEYALAQHFLSRITISNEKFYVFMMVSMGLGFVPLMLVLIAGMMIAALMGFVAYLPARLIWVATATPTERQAAAAKREAEAAAYPKPRPSPNSTGWRPR
jgi:hypothetical protein